MTLFDTECLLDVKGKTVSCTGYKETKSDIIFVRYLDKDEKEVHRESLLEANKRKAVKNNPSKRAAFKSVLPRYCTTKLKGTACNGVVIRTSQDKGSGSNRYPGICSVCGHYYDDYHKRPKEPKGTPKVQNRSVTRTAVKEQDISNVREVRLDYTDFVYDRGTVSNIIKALKGSLSISTQSKPIPYIALARAVRAIQAKQPNMMIDDIVRKTGVKAYMFDRAKHMLDFPVEIQKWNLDYTISNTICDCLNNLRNYPHNVPLKFARKVVAERLATAEARSIESGLKKIYELLDDNNIDVTPNQLCEMFDRALDPVKEERMELDIVAWSIINSVLKKENRPSLAISPTQVYSPEFEVLPPQPLYIKRKQKQLDVELAKDFGDQVKGILKKTDFGVVLAVHCDDTYMPRVCAFIGRIPIEDGEVYSDVILDEQCQTIKLFDDELTPLNPTEAHKLVMAIRTGEVVLASIQASKPGKKAKQDITYEGMVYTILSDELFDAAQTVYYTCLDDKGNTTLLSF